MKNHIKYIPTTLLIVLMSCNSRTIQFNIANELKDQISNIQISVTGSKRIDLIQLADNKSITYELSMADIPKTDGNFEIEFERNGKSESQDFGYYTNGYPLNEKYIINILEEEIDIKEE